MMDDDWWERLHQREQEERQREDEWFDHLREIEYNDWMYKRWLVEYVGGGVL